MPVSQQPDGMDSDHLGFSREGILHLVQQLRGGAKGRLPYDNIRLCISVIVSALTKRRIYGTYSFHDDLLVHRARQISNKKWFMSANELGPPLPEQTKIYGRCHQPSRPLYYCSLYEDTALSEVNAELHEQYVISTFTLSKGSILVPIGELDYFRRTGQTYMGSQTPYSADPYKEALAKEDGVECALFDAFMADEFIRPATTQVDYKVTSAFADVLLYSDWSLQSPIDAIVYPSVAFREGLNFAIRPQAYRAKLKLVEAKTKIIEISDVLGYGIFEYQTLATLKSVNPDGYLNWETVE
ncbi:MAG TPA: hypothetical protein DDY39_08145 [Nitrospira sp.]|nr:hypothetical protein [Nitrospira sp.]HBR51663.1 hypothetical protein [Nitrospira sp.]